MSYARALSGKCNDWRMVILAPGKERLGPFVKATKAMRERFHGFRIIDNRHQSNLQVIMRPLVALRERMVAGVLNVFNSLLWPSDLMQNSQKASADGWNTTLGIPHLIITDRTALELMPYD